MAFRVKIALALVIGLALGIVLAGVGVLVAGAGHGWVTPFWFSVLGLAIYPLAVFRLLSYGDQYTGVDFGLILIGALLDAGVYAQTIEENFKHFDRLGSFLFVWIGLWALWQVALIFKVAFAAFAARCIAKN